MKKLFTALMGSALMSFSAFAQKGLVISEILANPNGTDSPFEYVELLATTSINFATTPYTVVFTNNGAATSNGWKEGGAITYAFQINSGSVTAGQVVYVGGSSMLPLSNGGVAIRSINTSTTNGDVFGTKSSDVLGNGGDNADGVAVFNMATSAVNGSKVPIDAIFFGDAVGSAFKSTGSGYQLPVNDIYNGAKLQTTSFLAPDPGADQLVKATGGVYSTSTGTFTTARTWTVTTTTSYNTTSITIGGGSNQAPTVSITAPSSGATFTAPASVAITASASDADGSISKVEFYNGSTLLGTSTTSPYSYTWGSVAAGSYTLTAKAYDNLSAVTTSSAVSIAVNAGTNQAPTVSLTSPTNGATYTAPATVSIAATAADADGSISKVEFYNGSTLLGSDASSPYSYSWASVAAGSYTLTAKAYDNLSAVTTSSAVSITVNAGTNQAPTVSLTSPTNGATYTAPATVSIAATAADADGSISKVEFYNGSTLLGSDATSPYSYSWTSVAVGSYTITAKAYDNLSIVTTSTAVGITVNAANVAPTLSFNTSASKLVDLASGTVSCVIGDVTSPVSVSGLDITVGDESLTTLTFSMTSSSTSVVPTANFSVTGTSTVRKFIITPTGVGYSTITLKVTDNGGLTKSISFSLAVSAKYTTGSVKDFYHTGSSDASASIVVDSNYMFTVDDETNIIGLYNRKASGLPIYTFDPTSHSGLTDDLEMDLEAAFISPTNPHRIYWFTSEGNSKKGNIKPDRDRVFATDMVGTGASTTLTFVGYYQGLRSKIISWGDANGYSLSSSSADGEIPKEIDGYNIEGAVMGPDNTTAYICFRAPYVPVSSRTKALICPITNFESWFGNGSPSASPVFASPIELNLGTRGFRDIEKNASNQYIIIAGSYDATANFALYTWNGQSTSAPVQLNVNLTGLSPEGIAQVPASLSGTFQMELISDNGSDIIYNDGNEQKDLTTVQYRRFVSSIVSIGSAAKMAISLLPEENESTTTNADDISIKVYPNPVINLVTIDFADNTQVASKYYVFGTNGTLVKELTPSVSGKIVSLDMSGLEPGNYIIMGQGMKKAIKIAKQ